MNNIHEVLNYIQKNIVAPKTQFNKFGGYNYRSCEDILEAVKKILPDNAFLRISDEVKVIGDRFYVMATATLSYREGLEYKEVSASAYAREALNKKGMDEAQVTGSASSYARKYALNGLFCIDDSKDDDCGIQEDAPKFKQKAASNEIKRITKDEAMELIALIREKGKTEEGLCKYYQVDNVLSLTPSQYNSAIAMLNGAKK